MRSQHVPRLDPSFLICSERSGSNLIRSILNAHPRLHAPPPLHLGAFWERAEEFGDLEQDRRWRALLAAIVEFLDSWKGTVGQDLALALDVDELDAAITAREFVSIYEQVYSRGLAASGKAQLFIKENHTAQRAAWLLAAYPDAKFVYQVRDPRDYLASCKQMPAYKYGSAAAALAVWCADHRAALELAEALPAARLLHGRYEDLIHEPEAYLRRLCAFLDLPYLAQMLEFHKTEDARWAATHAAWRNLSQPIMRGNSGRYAEQLSAEEIELVEGHAGELMARLGYAPGAGRGLPRARDPRELEAFGAQPHLIRLDGDSGSVAVQRTIDRHLAGLSEA